MMDIEWHRRYGLHSNIPSCCVEFFCAQVENGVIQIARNQWEAYGFHWTGLRKTSHPEYVLCDICMKQFVEGRTEFPPLHHCAKEDPNCELFLIYE